MRPQQGRPSRCRPADRGIYREESTGPLSTVSTRHVDNLILKYGSPEYVFGRITLNSSVQELSGRPLHVHQASVFELPSESRHAASRHHPSKPQQYSPSLPSWQDNGVSERLTAIALSDGETQPATSDPARRSLRMDPKP